MRKKASADAGPVAKSRRAQKTKTVGGAKARGGVSLSGSMKGLATIARARRDLDALRLIAEGLHKGPVRLDVATLSDPEIRRVNLRFLGHDFATDVVSFPLLDTVGGVLEGSLAVSRDTAVREAARRGHAPYHEWMLYVVHGTLHLLGQDDHAPAARRRMRAAERDVLAQLGLPPVFDRAGVRDPQRDGEEIQ